MSAVIAQFLHTEKSANGPSYATLNPETDCWKLFACRRLLRLPRPRISFVKIEAPNFISIFHCLLCLADTFSLSGLRVRAPGSRVAANALGPSIINFASADSQIGGLHATE
jgi:hypothetical protein